MSTSHDRPGGLADNASPHSKTYPQWARRFNSNTRAESPWARKVVISLDGGGVRGYSSLLILEALVSKIRSIEYAANPRYESSAACYWSDCEHEDFEGKFLLHHYIDYFFGTSTGGLTAIMLGRLNYTVEDAMRQYHHVGLDVFKHHRLFSRGIVKLCVPKLSTRRMNEAMKRTPLRVSEDPKKTDRSTKRTEKVDTYIINNTAAELRMRNDNLDAPRTVAVATLSPSAEPYLFRSYDHPAPVLVKARNAHLNHGSASEAPVWEVARATSAAPGWFSPMSVNRRLFKDGAMSGHNNPVKLAYNEVKQLSQEQEPILIISIGTNSKERTSQPTLVGNERNVTLKSLWQEVKAYRDRLSASHDTHLRFLNKHEFEQDCDRNIDPNKAMYFRFDVQEPFEGVHLADWRGEKGAQTIEAITRPTKAYLESRRVHAELTRCAQHLVDIRRERAKTARWEAFALDGRLYYSCPQARTNAACARRRFHSRYDLRQHAFESHGFARRIPCEYHARESVQSSSESQPQRPSPQVIAWTCYQDECEEVVKAFDHDEDFLRHFREKHHDQNDPRISQDHELEGWLDEGRKWMNLDESHGTISRAPTGYESWHSTRM